MPLFFHLAVHRRDGESDDDDSDQRNSMENNNIFNSEMLTFHKSHHNFLKTTRYESLELATKLIKGRNAKYSINNK